MFTSLHALAKQATLMITIAPEGDDQLRVNVTPVPADSKTKAKLPQPLSLVATPAEFDSDFATALTNWVAPKRSLVQQVQDVVGDQAASPAAVIEAPKPDGKADAKGKGGRKKNIDKPAAEQDGASAPDGGDAADEAPAGDAIQAPDADGSAVPAPAAPVAATDAAIDVHTLDLF